MKKMIILAIALVILTIGAASAADNLTSKDLAEITSDEIEIDDSTILSENEKTDNLEQTDSTPIGDNNTKENVTIASYGFYGEGDVIYKTVTPEEVISEYGLHGQYGIYIETPTDSHYNLTGNVTFHIDGKIVGDDEISKYDLGFTSGYILWKNYKMGNHTIILTYSGDEHFNAATKTFNYEYLGYILTGAKDIVMYYNDARTMTLMLYKYDKPAGANKVVKIEIGKKKFSAKTGKNGVIKFKIPNAVTPGKYNVKISYLDAKANFKLTVKQILTLKTATVKKSAKKLVLQATLKKGKTPLKNKQVTFKFNGKKYTAKTNNKGVAKVTIKSNVLKKLKVGKKITYQATYLKDTVKKTVKVKK